MTVTVTERVADQTAHSWRLLTERIADEADDRLRANLELVARHVDAEARGDIPALMATLVPEPTYELFGAARVTGPNGYDAVKAYHEASNEAGHNRMEFELSRVTVDRDSVVTEGVMRHAFSGASLLALGADHEPPLEPDDWYLIEYPALTVWMIGACGLIEGERVYFGELPQVRRKLRRGECPHLGPVSRSYGVQG
jgi:hypothetical protein